MNTLSRVSLLVVSSLIAGVTMFTPALARDGNDDRCAGSRDLKLVNGKNPHLRRSQFDRIVRDDQERQVRGGWRRRPL